ncbi:VTT domain-containing protein [Paenibacillus sp. N1-5-1-14]|uniref:YqaA family protein n=1 Tax=Paenibacillus radicibacter TaxID=2972488 RepID=UPI00215993C0|nr:VTT domain-containing protein [Paenibacillus radicibacter]MCR8642814.1 VTT domain-containing protein [Paenibacillus radicibacter]
MDIIMEFLRGFGPIGMFIHGMIDAIIFPIPAFFLQIYLSAIDPDNVIWLATLGFVGSLLGTPIGYLIGKKSGDLILKRYVKKKWMDKATGLFHRHGEVAILIGSFTPIPFKLFTIMAGCMNYSLWKLLGYAAIGRAAKFYIVGVLFYIYGHAAEQMVDRTLMITMLGFGTLIVAGWLLIRFVQRRKKQQREVTLIKEVRYLDQSRDGN